METWEGAALVEHCKFCLASTDIFGQCENNLRTRYLIYCIQLKFAYFSILDEIQALIWDITFQLQLKLGTLLKCSNTAVLEYMIFNSLSMKSSDSNTNMMLHCIAG